MIVTSAQNPKIKHVLGLIDRRRMRQRYRQFFVEGVRAINAACEYGWGIEWLIYCPERDLSDWAQGVIAHSDPATHLPVNAYLMERISQRTEPSELAAVVRQAEDDLARVPLSDRLLVALVDRPQSPGNLGSLIRSCDALGVDALLISGHAVDLYAPRTVRASMGSFFALPVIRLDSLDTLETWVAEHKMQVVGTSAHADEVVFEHDFSGPTLIVLGNEAEGMSHRLAEMCDASVKIPMSGSASSLNVAAAAAILLYEVSRQRTAAQRPSPADG